MREGAVGSDAKKSNDAHLHLPNPRLLTIDSNGYLLKSLTSDGFYHEIR